MKAFQDFHIACITLSDTIVEELNIPTLLDLWNNDLQLWTGCWWWMDKSWER